MLKVFVAIFVIFTGVIAIDDLCEEPLDIVCIKGEAPRKFPETEKEFENLCKFVIPYFECALDYGERCDRSEKFKSSRRTYLEVSREVCNENTPFFAAVVENLKCYYELLEECDNECYADSVIISKFAESMSEDGHLTLPEDETERYNIYACIRELLELACYASKLEEKCGTVAMDTYVEITKKLGPAFGCTESDSLIPVFFRRYKLEQEKTNVLPDVFRKRK